MIGYVANNTPRYRCYSQIRYLPDEPFCRGVLRADAVEPATWREIERVRSDPDIILTELERREQRGVATQQDIKKERRAIQKALASLEREAQRWDEAYAEEVIDLGEFKAKKRDISERKQRLLTQQDGVWTATRSAQQYQAKTRDILTYCLRVKDQLGVLDTPHKRQALEALDIRVA
jgi:hypothetical protein